MPTFAIYWKSDHHGYINAPTKRAALELFLEEGPGVVEDVEVLEDGFSEYTDIELVTPNSGVVHKYNPSTRKLEKED